MNRSRQPQKKNSLTERETFRSLHIPSTGYRSVVHGPRERKRRWYGVRVAAGATKLRSMLTHNATCPASASTRLGFVDITDQIQAAVAGSAVTDGRITIMRPEPGCTLVVNEQEKGLHADVQATIRRLGLDNGSGTPPVGSASLVLPVVGGRVHLGTWQRILMLELEEPRPRPLVVQVVGE